MIRLRRLTSLCVAFSFLAMSYTGILLFIAPKGRVAYWTDWHLLGLDKTQYTNLHVSFMILFLIGSIVHIYLNVPALLSYLKTKASTFSFFNKELLLALAFNLFFWVGTLYFWQPFDAFLDFSDQLKNSWEQKADSKAPYGHAELSSLEEFAMRTSTPLSQLVQTLTDAQLKAVDPSKRIIDIAQSNGYSPAQMFGLMAKQKSASTSLQEGGGYGRLSLEEASKRQGFSLPRALVFLREKGFDARDTSTLKEISDALNTKPMMLLEQLKTLEKDSQ